MLAQGNNQRLPDQGGSRGRSRTQDQKTRTVSTCRSNLGVLKRSIPKTLAFAFGLRLRSKTRCFKTRVLGRRLPNGKPQERLRFRALRSKTLALKKTHCDLFLRFKDSPRGQGLRSGRLRSKNVAFCVCVSKPTKVPSEGVQIWVFLFLSGRSLPRHPHDRPYYIIGANTPKCVPLRWGRPPFDPTQTGLCKFRWVWSSLTLDHYVATVLPNNVNFSLPEEQPRGYLPEFSTQPSCLWLSELSSSFSSFR